MIGRYREPKPPRSARSLHQTSALRIQLENTVADDPEGAIEPVVLDLVTLELGGHHARTCRVIYGGLGLILEEFGGTRKAPEISSASIHRHVMRVGMVYREQQNASGIEDEYPVPGHILYVDAVSLRIEHEPFPAAKLAARTETSPLPPYLAVVPEACEAISDRSHALPQGIRVVHDEHGNGIEAISEIPAPERIPETKHTAGNQYDEGECRPQREPLALEASSNCISRGPGPVLVHHHPDRSAPMNDAHAASAARVRTWFQAVQRLV